MKFGSCYTSRPKIARCSNKCSVYFASSGKARAVTEDTWHCKRMCMISPPAGGTGPVPSRSRQSHLYMLYGYQNLPPPARTVRSRISDVPGQWRVWAIPANTVMRYPSCGRRCGHLGIDSRACVEPKFGFRLFLSS